MVRDAQSARIAYTERSPRPDLSARYLTSLVVECALFCGLIAGQNSEDFFRINRDKGSCAPRQHLTRFIADFGDVDVLAAFHRLLISGNRQHFAQGNRFEIADLHGTGEGQHIAKTVHLAHGFVKNRGDDTAMRMSGWTGVTARQLEFTD